jgi:hypothetical protein
MVAYFRKINYPERYILLYEGAIFVPIAVPVIFGKLSPLEVNIVVLEHQSRHVDYHSVGGIRVD